MTELELYKNTMNHNPSGKYMFYTQFVHDKLVSFAKYVGLDINKSDDELNHLIAQKFGMFDPYFVVPKNVKKPNVDIFKSYYNEIPERGFINYLGVLELPSADSWLSFYSIY